jgi:hypothetical protein
MQRLASKPSGVQLLTRDCRLRRLAAVHPDHRLAVRRVISEPVQGRACRRGARCLFVPRGRAASHSQAACLPLGEMLPARDTAPRDSAVAGHAPTGGHCPGAGGSQPNWAGRTTHSVQFRTRRRSQKGPQASAVTRLPGCEHHELLPVVRSGEAREHAEYRLGRPSSKLCRG